MTTRTLKSRMQTAFSHAAPAAKQPVAPTATPRVVPMWRRVVAVAAALMLAIGCGAVYTYSSSVAIAAEVTIDVNPSVKLCLDRNDIVRKAVALNEDAAPVLETLDLVGKTADEAVELLVDALVEHGFLDADANSVLMSVNAKDENKGNALGKRLCNSVETAANRRKFKSAVLCQNLHVTDELRAKAEENGISPGKALLIEKILQANPDSEYTFEQLAEKKVNELNVIGGKNVKNVERRGQAGKGKAQADGTGKGIGKGNGNGNGKATEAPDVEAGDTALSAETMSDAPAAQAAKGEKKQQKKQDGTCDPAECEQKQQKKQDGTCDPAECEQKQQKKQDGTCDPANGGKKQQKKQDGSCGNSHLTAADPA